MAYLPPNLLPLSSRIFSQAHHPPTWLIYFQLKLSLCPFSFNLPVPKPPGSGSSSASSNPSSLFFSYSIDCLSHICISHVQLSISIHFCSTTWYFRPPAPFPSDKILNLWRTAECSMFFHPALP